jgi:photosystem II stability/assembly factor-like uncharacterized protein
MALWVGLFAIAIGAIAFVLTSIGGRDSGGSSRFQVLHTFGTADYHSLAFDPARDGAVLFGHHNGVQISEDGGETWENVVDESGRDAMNLVIDPFSSDIVYMAGHGVYMKSEDGGRTWDAVDSDLPGLDLHTFAASPATMDRLYAVPVGFGLYESDDGGTSWRPVPSDVPPGTNSIVELPDGTLLLGATDAGILRSEDGGKSWLPSRTGIDSGVVLTLRATPTGERIYAGTTQGLFVSADGGETWTQTALDDTFALVVGVNPGDPLNVMVVNGEGDLYRSRDGGMTWR